LALFNDGQEKNMRINFSMFVLLCACCTCSSNKNEVSQTDLQDIADDGNLIQDNEIPENEINEILAETGSDPADTKEPLPVFKPVAARPKSSVLPEPLKSCPVYQ
jgi:hypothetical protein